MSEPKIFLIDAHALCYRAYFAIKNLSTSYGQATNAVYGFVNTLKKILREYRPEYVAVCFDVGKKTIRQEKFARYKIHRPAMPDNLISQIPMVKDVVSAFGLPIFEMERFEADDLIATLTHKARKEGLKVVIVSGDKDMLQLVNENVHIFNARQNKILNAHDAEKQMGFSPNRITDFIGLAGDHSDNIPGVAGVGDVTAKNLINEFGSLENILENIEKIKSKGVKEKILAQKDKALFSKELAILDNHLPIPFDLKQLSVGEPDRQRLFEIFKKLEFKKMAEELACEINQDVSCEFKEVNEDKVLEAVIANIQKKKRFVFLLDTPKEGQELIPLTMAVCGEKKVIYQIPEERILSFRVLFEDKTVLKVSYDMKEQMKILNHRQIFLQEKIFDIKLAGYLLSPSLGDYSIENLAWEYSRTSLSARVSLENKAHTVFQLFGLLQAQLREKALLTLFDEIEMPLVHVLFRMETDGVRVDKKLLARLSKETEIKMRQMETRLFGLAGEKFNLNSPKQLSHILFEKLKLPVIKKTKTGFSTDEGVLVRLSEEHPLPALILEYRQMAKLKSTYFDVLPQLVNPMTGRIHASFNQTGTETGRLSSSNPNLQNIPIRTDLGRQIRKAFVASDQNYLLISADYSQIELRILAHLSGDENLRSAFQRDEDIHSFTATLIFEIPPKEVTTQMRDTAKRVNFSVISGMSPFGLAKDLGISQKEAEEFINKYFLRYPGVRNFIDQQVKTAQDNGYVCTIFNRRRYLPEINSPNMAVRQFAQRQAVNTPVQGSAADLIKLAMIHVQRELEKKSLSSRMIISVHDELVFEVPRGEKTLMMDLIREKMEHSLSLSVPIKISMKIGRNWLEMQRT